MLKPGGIFTAFDCDWPLAFLWQAEQAYETLFAAPMGTRVYPVRFCYRMRLGFK